MGQITELITDLPIIIRLSNIIDVALVAFVVYKIIGWISDTQAEQVAKGVVILLIITQLSELFGLHTVNFILRNLLTVGFIAIIILFQPELRRALEQLGRTKFFQTKWLQNVTDTKKSIDEIIEAINEFSKNKTGALIVLEKETGLEDIIMTGISLDSIISKPLLLNLFTHNTPLHDGAVIIRLTENRLKAASCLLPLTENKNISKSLGTRHRAGLGMSENSDCIVIIVSEESGVISYAKEGKLHRYLDVKGLNKVLDEEFIPKEDKPMKFKFWGNHREEQSKED